MAVDVTGGIPRYEANDTKRFTWASTATPPSTVAFNLFNTDGASLAPEAVQASSFFVAASGGGVFFVDVVLPTSVGLYFYQWRPFDAASRPYTMRGEFEIVRTEPHSFWTYADVLDVTRTGRQVFGRADITQRDLRPYLEEADAFIDSMLGRVMTVPVTPTPNLLVAMSKVFALANFYSDRYSVEDEGAPPAIIKRRDDYVEFLSSVVSGTAVLVTSGGVTTSIQDAVTALTGSLPGAAGVPVFGLRDPENQVIDADITQAEADKD